LRDELPTRRAAGAEPILSQAAGGPPPFRADHIGSLLRPARLRQAFRDHSRGRVTDADFHAIQNDAIRAVVALQAEIGFGAVNDGEYRRGSYWSRFVERTQGLGVREAIYKFRDDQGQETAFTAPFVEAPVRRRGGIAVDEVRFVRSLTDRVVKVTLPAPSTMHFWRGLRFAEPGVYEDATAFLEDLGRVYRAEIAELAQAGARYIQLDEVALAMLCDPAAREKVTAAGLDPESLLGLYVDAINGAVADRPPGLVVGVHMCRGNFKGKYLAEGGYDSVAEHLFGAANVDHFLLEYDTPRAGDFAPLRFVPRTKGVVLGLISSKTPALEPLDLLKRRVADAARYVDGERLALSPQCGFASTVAGNPVTEADMHAKLALVVEGARAIWG
jgi:5-methyltetrahydropteroyltriglutamate--homocysteine methyltransferase